MLSTSGRNLALISVAAVHASPFDVALVGRWLLDAALGSPLYKAVLMPQAKATMVQTAESNGVAWRDQLAWIKDQGPWSLDNVEHDEKIIPDYYRQPFHAYEDGNLCWESAWEGEIASRAVGARNYPKYGAEGEDAFRGAFDEALASLGAKCPPGGTIVDLGCGSGISTRRLAAAHPQAARILGLDLSPHFLAVGRRLLELAPEAEGVVAPVGQPWVQPLGRDRRIELRHADAARTGLADGEADVVCLSLVIHELPPEVTRQVAAEAWTKDCRVWAYRGVEQPWEAAEIEMAVPLSPRELAQKIQVVFHHKSQRSQTPVAAGLREPWQQAEQQNRALAANYDKLGLADYEALEGFSRAQLD